MRTFSTDSEYDLGYFEAIRNVVLQIALTTPEEFREWLAKELAEALRLRDGK